MNKSITWFKLWQLIGKQPLCNTRGKKVELLINGCRYEVELVFDHNGSEFHLEPTVIVKDLRKAEVNQ